MHEQISIDRKLPPHELNARRSRKRVVTCLPAVAQLSHGSSDKPAACNHEVCNPATDAVTDARSEC